MRGPRTGVDREARRKYGKCENVLVRLGRVSGEVERRKERGSRGDDNQSAGGSHEEGNSPFAYTPPVRGLPHSIRPPESHDRVSRPRECLSQNPASDRGQRYRRIYCETVLVLPFYEREKGEEEGEEEECD